MSADTAPQTTQPPAPIPERYVSLFWRLFVPNATVLGVAGAVLWIQPANGRVVALAGGVLMMLAVNWVLMRRTVSPLLQLARVMHSVDPLEPGRRVAVPSQDSEVATLARTFNDMLDRIEFERRDSARRALGAQQRERHRLARELHDEIGQGLTAHAMHLQRIAASPDGVEKQLGDAYAAAQRLIEEVRSLAQSLRPDVLEHLGLTSALVNLIERVTSQTGLRVERALSRDLGELDSETELVIYRVTQEALNNVVRHAEASVVEVKIERDGRYVRLTVADDGVGYGRKPRDERGGSGVRFMRERALLVGGRLSVGRRSPRGTLLTLTVPAAGIGDPGDGHSMSASEEQDAPGIH